MLRRKRASQRIGAIMALALTLGLVTGVTSAAALTVPSGNVDLHDLLAGQARTFKLTITHTGSAGGGIGPLATPADPNINVVRITPPIGLISPTAARGPAGSNWTPTIIGDPPDIIFQGATLSPQNTAVFEVDGTLERRPADDQDDWLVEASDNGGQNFKRASGNFLTKIRVLQTQSVSVVAPAGATDLTVTATQSGVCARTRVLNAGSATLNVTPTLTGGSNVTVGQPRLANAAAPCSNPAISSAPIAAGGTQEFDFPVSFGTSGTRTLVADASAAGADAFDTNVNVTVQPKAVLSYVGGSLRPRALPPAAQDEAFHITVNKAPSGSPAIDLVPADTTFEFAACTPPHQLASTSGALGAGAVSNVELSFAPCDLLASVGNGKYDVEALYGYVDANGLVQGATDLNVGDQINLDDLIPDVDVRLIPPANRVDANQPGAISRGNAFTFEVDVFDRNPATGLLVPCGASNGVDGCSLHDTAIAFYDDNGIQIGDPVPVPINNSDGTNSTTLNWTTQIPDGAVTARGQARAEDDPGNSSELEFSDPADVDLIRPVIDAAGSLPSMGRREVLVTFSELVRFGLGDFSRLDWTVEVQGQDNPVQDVRRPLNEDGSTDFRRAILTVQNPLPCDIPEDASGDPDANVRYELFELPGNPTGGSRGHDRVGLTLENQTRLLGDGIAPLAPIVEQVQGRDEQVGKYWFNDNQPAVQAGNQDDGADCLGVADGYGVELFLDSNDTGAFEPGADQSLASADADDVDVTITDYSAAFSGNLTNGDQQWFERKVFVRAEDTNGNLTPVADVTVAAADFLLDQKAPTITGLAVAGNDATVTLSEDSPFGRDFPLDWRFFGIKAGRTLESRFTIGGIGGGPGSRTLTVDDPSYGPTVTNHRSEYLFFGPAADRYTDRAGNLLGDASVSAAT